MVRRRRIDRWSRSLPEAAWTKLNVRDGEQGPLEIEVSLRRVQVRNGIGWHHHQTLSLITAWFLNEETRREKIQTPAMTVPQARRLIAAQIEQRLQSHTPTHTAATTQRWLQRNQLARASRDEARHLLPPLKYQLRT